MKHTALPLKVEHHHMQDGSGGIITSKIYKNTPNSKSIFLCKLYWNEELADSLVHRYNCHEELVEALAELYDQIHDTVPIIDSYPWVSESLDKAFNALTNATK